MKYIYFGTPEFSAIILEKLIKANFIPTAIVTNPDRPTGRKKMINPPPVKSLLMSLRAIRQLAESVAISKIEILQPEKLDDELIFKLKNLCPEFAILAAYGKIIPKSIIDIFPKGIIVVHPSLLPKYRGATPIHNALLNDEKETGTTLILMDEKVDHGAILAQAKIALDNNDDYDQLSKKLAVLSADLLIETLPKYLLGKIKPQKQNKEEATYTKKLASNDGYINPKDLNIACHSDDPPTGGEEGSLTAKKIWLKIRALNPEPGVWTIADQSFLESLRANSSERGNLKNNLNKRVKLLAADFQNGKLILKKIQIEGEKPKII